MPVSAVHPVHSFHPVRPDAESAADLACLARHDAGLIRSSSRLFAAIAALAAIAATALIGGCSTLGGGVGSESVDVRSPPAAGTELVFQTRNGYNGEPRSLATHRFTADGSRLDGIDYEEPADGGFGTPTAALVARQFDAAGDLVAIERADGTRTTFTPPLRTLPPALVPGQRTRQSTVAQDSNATRPRRVVMIVRVGGWETVRVPAGEFRALRVSRDVFLGDSRFNRTETTRQEIDWYAPDIGAVVRASEDSAHEDLMAGRDLGNPAPIMRGDWLTRELIQQRTPAAAK